MSLLSQSPRAYVIDQHTVTADELAGGLYLVATPIGNLADITLRALATLVGADMILCEDTRMTSKLLQRYHIKTRMKPYHDHNAARQRPAIMAELAGGKAIALVSDAGTPLVSDPGYKLVKACVDEDLPVHMIPGVSAPVMALALSGLPSDRFLFCGFVPTRQAARRQAFQEVSDVPATLIFFDTAQRIAASLSDIVDTLGDRDVAIGREMTKLHEEFLRGRASAVGQQLAERASLKGEITLVVAPPARQAASADSAAVREALISALGELPASRAAAQTARRFGLPKKALYEQALRLKADPPQ
ncbi:MAG: 16S rRNA (cytidine(1402)-2'-O)-methyltransferase [Aestuariivirgaceae bacterium]